MGTQRKKSNSWRCGIFSVLLLFACFMMFVGFNVVSFSRTVNTLIDISPTEDVNDGSEIERFWGTQDGIRETRFAQEEGKVYYIRTAGQLAYMSYAISSAGALRPEDSGWDYSGCTFILENDINLNDIYIQNIRKTVYPFWTPIDIGKFGKNQNITFDGRGNKIIGMRIKYDHISTACNAGFFTNMVGGVFKNVTFVNPTIIYNYSGVSISENDPSRPKKPTDVCVGVIAGAADSTYISNVEIINPIVTFAAENVNAHNFCVGTAVGKLSFTSQFNENDKISSSNTVTAKQWGIDTVNVKEDNSLKFDSAVQPTLTMSIGQGVAVDTSYGKATYGYLGGVVGVNVSSKVINSTLKNYAIIPDISESTEGAYYIGGVAGLTTQITTSERLLVAAGLYNNLLQDVKLGNISNTDSDTRYCGDIVGRVYSGGWVYNNMFIGDQSYTTTAVNGVKDLQLWEDVSNAKIHLGESLDSDDCIGHDIGALDMYYFDNSTNNYIGDSGCHYAVTSDGYVYCSTHQTDTVLLNSNDNYGTEEEMEKYNFHFSSLDAEDYNHFIDDIVYEPVNENINYTQFELMSSIESGHGLLYFAALPILKYEIGLTIDEVDADTGLATADYEKLLQAVNQFRAWSLLGNEPALSSYFGADCSVTFIANAQSTISEACFEDVKSYGYIERNPQKVVVRSFQQIIYAPDKDPVCEGYEFKGWKIPGWDTASADLTTCPWRKYLDDDGFYKFGEERVTSPGRTFVAIWEIKQFTVSYMIRQYSNDGETYVDVPFADKPTEEVTFANTLKGIDEAHQPTSDQGLVFVGWFLEENLPIYGEDANSNLQWKFGQANGNKMPGHDIILYAGWINNFSMLSQLLDNENFVKYNTNYDVYFDEVSGTAFHDAYVAAYQARSDGDNSNASVLLNTLQETFDNLRIDPKNILKVSAFNEELTENTCPFLYDSNVYLSYLTFKEIVQKYANAEPDETTFKNIDAFIKNYEKINELFNSLKNNLKSSVTTVGGVNSQAIQNLIKKYQDLEKNYEALYKNGEYSQYDMTELDSAEKLAKQRWTEINRDLVLRDIESVVADYETAFSNLQPKSIIDNGGKTNNKDNDTKSQKNVSILGMSPVVFSILIVALLGSLAFGYIGIDFVLNKKRYGKNKVKSHNTTKQDTIVPEEDTYI